VESVNTGPSGVNVAVASAAARSGGFGVSLTMAGGDSFNGISSSMVVIVVIEGKEGGYKSDICLFGLITC
jgi:hypothetical protein